MKKILVTIPANEQHKERLERHIKDFDFQYVLRKDVTKEQVQEAAFIIGNVPQEYIEGSTNLKLLQLNSAGTDGYTDEGVLAAETILCNATGAYGQSVAEHMLAMLMAIQKKLPLYRDDQLVGEWNDYGRVTSISNATIVVIGLGDIGTYFAKLAKALGAYVIGVKRRPADCPKEVDELHLIADLKKVLPKADIVFSVLPNTKETRKIYNEDFFKDMKKGSIFMNAGRGNAVDQEALLDAIRNETIGAAGLDVTDPEPLPKDHPLWKERNIFITPHVSGQYHLSETLDRIVEIGASNVEAYLNGGKLVNVIDFETGYCK